VAAVAAVAPVRDGGFYFYTGVQGFPNAIQSPPVYDRR